MDLCNLKLKFSDETRTPISKRKCPNGRPKGGTTPETHRNDEEIIPTDNNSSMLKHTNASHDDDSLYIPSDSENCTSSSINSSDFESEDEISRPVKPTADISNTPYINDMELLPKLHPINVAAYFQLISEHFHQLGENLQGTEGPEIVPECLCQLLDSMVCALGALLTLTAHIPEFKNESTDSLEKILDNISYIMPSI